MSYAQQQIVSMAPELSDNDAAFVADFMSKLIILANKANKPASNEKMLAFERLDKIVAGFTPVLDPDEEMAEARDKKYGIVD